MKVLCVVSSYWSAFQFGGPVTAEHCLNKVPIKKGVDLEVYITNVGIEREVPVNNETSVDGITSTSSTAISFASAFLMAKKGLSFTFYSASGTGFW